MDRFSEGNEPEAGQLVYAVYERPDDRPLPPYPTSSATLHKPDDSENETSKTE